MRSFVTIVQRSSLHSQLYNSGSRASPLHNPESIINADIVGPAADGSQPFDAAFSWRLKQGILPNNSARPINNLKRDADMYLGNVHSSFAVDEPGRYTRIEPIAHPLHDTNDNTFTFVCFNGMETEDAKLACGDDPSRTIFASTTKNSMALCPKFFAFVRIPDVPEQAGEEEQWNAIGEAVWNSIEYDKGRYQSSRVLSFPTPFNPGE